MLKEFPHILKPKNLVRGYCRCCKKSIAGNPAYECSACRFFIHESCLETIQKTETEVKHELNERHHFFKTKITMMKLQDDDENEAVCSMCKEIVPHLSGKSAPIIYKCFIPNCDYLIHKSCTEAPEVIKVHHLHANPYHWLILKPPTEIQHFCRACGKHRPGSFFYECDECEYEIDIQCSFRWKVSSNKCNPHTFIPIGSQIEFTCQVCGEKNNEMGSVCSDCRFLIHTNCARFPRIIKVIGHDHSLTITQPLSQHKCQGSQICQVCEGNMNKDHGAYCCEQVCGFIAHLWCAYFEEDQSETIGSTSYRNLLVEEEIKVEHIREKTLHSSLHEDELILMKEEPKGKICEGCGRLIFLPQFYGCEKCKFYVHIKCAQVPTEINRPLIHRHRLRLQTTHDHFWCWECDCIRNGFFYTCDKCSWAKYDIQCALIPEAFNRKLHKHRLFRGWGPRCSACGERWVRKFKCKTCTFWLCNRCVTLPLVATHKYDKHLLRLTNELEDYPEECYCQICEKKLDIDYWFYYCKDCDFISHPNCVF